MLFTNMSTSMTVGLTVEKKSGIISDQDFDLGTACAGSENQRDKVKLDQ